MPSKIDTIEVGGTEYVVVGPGSEYPVSVILTSGTDDVLVGCSEVIGTTNLSFRWMRTGTEGAYKYSLVACVSDDGPENATYEG